MPATKLQDMSSKAHAPETMRRITNKTRNRCARAILDQSNACRSNLSFAGLVALARSPNPIPSRTRPLNSSAPMVLCLKTWESRSLPGLPMTDKSPQQPNTPFKAARQYSEPLNTIRSNANQASHTHLDAGWSSPVARQAHNLKVTGSNPVPATRSQQTPRRVHLRGVCRSGASIPTPAPPCGRRSSRRSEAGCR